MTLVLRNALTVFEEDGLAITMEMGAHAVSPTGTPIVVRPLRVDFADADGVWRNSSPVGHAVESEKGFTFRLVGDTAYRLTTKGTVFQSPSACLKSIVKALIA